jgi:hypothetical protein
MALRRSRLRRSGRWSLATLFALTAVLTACGKDELDVRMEDCHRIDAAFHKIQSDGRALQQDREAIHDLQKLKDWMRSGASQLHDAARQTSDVYLKRAVKDTAAQLDKGADDPMGQLNSLQNTLNAMLLQCTRAPGK